MTQIISIRPSRTAEAIAGRAIVPQNVRGKGADRPGDRQIQHFCLFTTEMLYPAGMNSDQAKRFLARQGCTFEKGKGGHLLVRREGRTSVLPQHGGRKQLGKGLWMKILKDLDLKE